MIWEIAPSPVTLQAVPKLSIVMYRAIIMALSASEKPRTELRTPSEAMIAPPGTPGAAIMVIANIPMNEANIPAW